MSGAIDQKLKDLGITIPDAPTPAANYVPYVVTGNQVFISGQVPVGPDGLEFQGKVPTQVSEEDAVKAARLCAINIISQVKAACGGDLDRVVRCVKLGGFVNGEPDFGNHPGVINGASDLLVEVFGDKGRHARFAVGAGNLPFNVAVEIDAVFEIA